MRARNSLVLAVAAAHLLATAGCYNTYRIQTSELTKLNSDLPGDETPRPLTTETGESVVVDRDSPLTIVKKNGDSFWRVYRTIDADPQTFSGVSFDGERVRVPAEAVDYAQVSKLNVPKTVLFGAGVGIAGIAATVLLIGFLVGGQYHDPGHIYF